MSKGNGTANTGEVIAVKGAVVDVAFEPEHLPEIYDSLEIERANQNRLVLEVQQHLGEGRVRRIAIDTTDGLRRGVAVRNTGRPITVPVGPDTLGRVFNVLGEAIDGRPQPKVDVRHRIHRKAPSFEKQKAAVEMLETGMKAIDLIALLTKGGKTGKFGGFVDIHSNRVIVLADNAERSEEIDVARAEAARMRAQVMLKNPPPNKEDLLRLESAYCRSEVRLRVARRHGERKLPAAGDARPGAGVTQFSVHQPRS